MRRLDQSLQTVVDWMRTLDYLSERPEVDAERIGFVGFSMGGMRGAPFVGIDKRGPGGVILHLGCEHPVRPRRNRRRVGERAHRSGRLRADDGRSRDPGGGRRTRRPDHARSDATLLRPTLRTTGTCLVALADTGTSCPRESSRSAHSSSERSVSATNSIRPTRQTRPPLPLSSPAPLSRDLKCVLAKQRRCRREVTRRVVQLDDRAVIQREVRLRVDEVLVESSLRQVLVVLAHVLGIMDE